MTQPLRLTCLALVSALLALPASANGTDPAPDPLELRLNLMVDGDRLVGFSYSAASGPNVATAGVSTPSGVATGAIASVNPVTTHEDEGEGFHLFSSQVGQTPQR